MSVGQQDKRAKKRGSVSDHTEEALEQQAATAEILHVIGNSPADLEPVFRTILSNASRLCQASVGAIFLFDGEVLTNVAHQNASREFAQFLNRSDRRPSRETTTRRCALERRTVHTADLMNDPDYAPPEFQRRENVRAALSVPMIRNSVLIGVITLWRHVTTAFTDRQIALVQTFADQAVIAIENVRLFKELQARNVEITESLEQQTATADILSVINSSPTDLQPVFDAILEKAIRLCDAHMGHLRLYDGENFLDVTQRGAKAEYAKFLSERGAFRPPRGGVYARMTAERRPLQIADIRNSSEYRDGIRGVTALVELGGARTFIVVPMLKDGRVVGGISIYRPDVRPFTQKQIDLVSTFANQAVIAIENVRLFKELEVRNKDLSETLEQQTATAEILRVMSNSPADVQPVFEAIVQSGIRLFEGAGVTLSRPENGQVRLMAIAERDPERVRMWKARFPFPLTREYMHGAAILDCRMVDMPDVEQMDDCFAAGKRNFAASGYRAMTVVPMIKDGAAIGTISVVRDAAGPLSDKKIALLKTFADQAVIAIENVRLFNETKEALEQQTAISEILHVISGSPGDVVRMLEAVALRAVKLCESGEAGIFLLEDERLKFAAGCQSGETFRPGETIPLSRGSVLGRAVIDRETVHVVDLAATVTGEFPLGMEYQKRFGHRSLVAVPLMQKDRAIGVIGLWRFEVREFSEKHIALVRTFADQAAIAIENVSLFNEIREKSRQLEIASRHKSEFLANMSHELRTPLNAIIGFTRIVMRRSREQIETRQYENLEKILTSGQHLLALINSILDLAKVEAGRVEINATEIGLAAVLESCARTIEPLVKTEAVTLVKEFDDTLPQMCVDEEKLRQIVINLLSNAAKFTANGSIRLRARALNDSVVIAVTDTGIGIAPDNLDVIFEEFAQADAGSTRVYGGTGLGLTIARRLARLMAGELTAESTIGSGSTFTLTLPLRYGSSGPSKASGV